MRWYLKAMRGYAVFRGRSPRAEFIEVWGALFLLVLVAQGLDREIFGGDGQSHTLLTHLVILAHVVPVLAVTARRLHDMAWSGWFTLLNLVPVLGFGMLLLACPRGTPGPNRYGADPLSTATGNEAPQHTTERTVPSPIPEARPAATDLVAELERFAGLRASGALSDAEFEVLKAQTLAQAGRA